MRRGRPLSEQVTYIFFILAAPLLRFINPGDPFGPLGAAAAILVTMAFLWRGRQACGPLAAVRALFPRGVFLRPSATLDLWVFSVNSILYFVLFGHVLIGVGVFRVATAEALTRLGIDPAPATNSWLGVCGATLVALIAYDLGYYIAHRLAHRIPILWRFHSAHHSAEVLTPFTSQRVHPIDIVLFGNCTGLVVGASLGVFGHVTGASPATLFGANAALFVLVAVLDHQRHSNVWIAFAGPVGHVLQSPAHHQLHHSDDPSHYGCNLGHMLSIFDWLFGTLTLPTGEKPARYGISEAESPTTLDGFYFGPFVPSAKAGLDAASPAARSIGEC
jgi:sterol desaturase/sphingolipid hydroxylase (fatty acid hydroxylase superfamily)